MSERLDTPLAELLLARGLVGRPLLSEALAHVRRSRGQDEQVSLALFLLERQAIAPDLLQRVLQESSRERSSLDAVAGAASAPASQQLGPYRLLRKIAEGGMGAVYEAEHAETGARYALKVIKAEVGELLEEAALERLRREARLSAALDHPNVVRVHAAEFEGSVPYLVQDLLGGGSLSERVLGAGVFAPEAAAELVARLAEGLAAAHAAGVLHRDLKPDNVLFSERGDPVLVDFGLSRRVSGNSIQLTQTGEILGTPAYMAPEQALDVTSAREAADVYALGAILFFALEGVAPFHGQTVLETLHLVLAAPAPEAASAPPALRALIARVMSKEPSARPSAAELAGLLRQSVAEPAAPSKVGPLAFAALIAVCALVAALIWARARAGSPAAVTPAATATSTPSGGAPDPQVGAFALAVREGRKESSRKLAAVELLRRAPKHPVAVEARTLARSLERRRLVQLPALPGRDARALGFLPQGRSLFAVNATSVGRYDLAGPSVAWSVSSGPEGVPISGGVVDRGLFWTSTSGSSGRVYSLPLSELGAAGFGGPVLSPADDWGPRLVDPTGKDGVSTLATSPGGDLLVRGRGSRIALYRIQDRQPLDLLILPVDAQRPQDAEQGRVLSGVIHLEFVGEGWVVAVMNKRLRDSLVGGVTTYPAGGLVALLSVKAGKLKLLGGLAVHQAATAVAVARGRVYVGDNIGGLLSYELGSFPTDPRLRLSASEARTAGRVEAAEQAPKRSRVCGLAVGQDGTFWTSHRETETSTKAQLGRWTPREGGWTYEVLGQTPLPSMLSLSPDGDLLLVQYHPEALAKKPGEVWFVGPVPGR